MKWQLAKFEDGTDCIYEVPTNMRQKFLGHLFFGN